MRCQCRLAGVARSSWYYEPVPESPLNLELMRRIDELYLNHPEYGSPRMTDELREAGYEVGRTRVSRLMRKMGLQAITPGPHTSRPHPDHPKYPYLLENMAIERVNQVWCSDITFIPMRRGFLYLAAVMDWRSRYVVDWSLSNTMEAEFCVELLDRALRRGTPTIFNTDQGSQFTSRAFTGLLEDRGVKVSMDGRGRALDNRMIERLWWSVKYEHVYPRDHETGVSLHRGLQSYFAHYNERRRHSSLGKKTPREIYLAGSAA